MNFSLILAIEFPKKKNYGSSQNQNFKIWQIFSVSRQLPPGIYAFRKIVPRTIAPEHKCPRWKFLPGQLPPGQLPSRKIDPRAIAPEENYSPENCPLIIKFPSKIIAPTQGNPPQRVLCVNWCKLYIAYEYYNIRVMQLRCKNRFTFIYFFYKF